MHYTVLHALFILTLHATRTHTPAAKEEDCNCKAGSRVNLYVQWCELHLQANCY